MDRVKKVLHLIKENINLLILIPTVLGGFWQLLELVRIEISFIRFFSLTQVVSDGLVVLFLLLIFVFINLSVFVKEKKDDNTLSPYEEYLAVKLLLLGLFVLGFGYSLYVLSHKEFTTPHLIILYTFFISSIKVIRDIIIKKYGDIFKDYYSLIVLLVFQISLYFMNSIFTKFHHLYYVPSNIKNIEYLECYTGKKQKDFELLYFNDKYVFVKDIKSKQIEIINFEEMLNKDNCK
ncbi:hypothetical protein B0I03_10562 [Flavobacterium aquaticum]|uniref:Uncharacterized protein n=1 Tax=Flavobacterium aquaticum TaxID=1236486 RepID=A0A327YL08_9FLAO|nr:hypothetical protein [Flavobacterium aquaticum]RAK21630.1 hypothetical protein B0I03_10562 [Flavobacterium aquaticum]